jgi:hypothetical protein
MRQYQAILDLSTLRASIDLTNRRARHAMWAIALYASLKVPDLVAPWCLSNLESAYWMAGRTLVGLVGWTAAAILFCRWLYRAYEDNRGLNGRTLEFSPTHAVASFFIPVLCFWQPYQAIRDLFVASDPETLPDAPRYEPSREVLYRSSARALLAPPDWNKRFPVRAWWACYMVLPLVFQAVMLVMTLEGAWFRSWEWGVAHPSLLVPASSALSFLASAASAALAIQVIRAIQARQGERLRRLEGSYEVAPPFAAGSRA